jgi:predicted flap endonuclease-1-like 5' DNA nuclease
MPIDRSARTLLAVTFFVGAALIAMNYTVSAATILNWWLPLLLFIVGLALALLNSRPAAAMPVEAPAEVAAEPAPVALAAPVETAPAEPVATAASADDLTEILGIGPKVATVLREAGITTFAALAATSTDQLREIATNAGLRLTVSLDTWAEQAALLAQGDRAGYDAWLQRHAEERKAE